jgi:hypothetical protein
MIQYLNWLRGQILEERLCLIMDQWTMHTAGETERETENFGIERPISPNIWCTEIKRQGKMAAIFQ